MTNFVDFLQQCQAKAIRFSLDGDQLKVNAPPNTLVPEMVAQLRHFKPELIIWLQEHLTSQPDSLSEFGRIGRADRNEKLPASFGQEQLWFSHQIENLGDGYHFVRVLDLVGDLNIAALNASFSSIIERHEALRTVFVQEEGMLFQRICAAVPTDIPVADLSAFNEEQKLQATQSLLQELTSNSFDLTNECMLRLQLLRLNHHHHQLIIVLHHIASDGWSLGIVVNEFQTLYSQYVQGHAASLAALPTQYADYAQWLRATMQGSKFEASLDYWKQQLAGVADVHNMPTDHPRPVNASFQGGHVYQTLDPSTLASLKQVAQQTGTTLFMVLETLFATLIARYSRSDDVVIGTPVANRAHPDVEGLIGYFVNMVALRHQFGQSQTLQQRLLLAKQEIVNAFQHEHIPFDRVVQAVVKTRSTSYSPLIQIAFVLQNNDIPEIALPKVTCRIEEVEKKNAVFDLQLEATETAQGIKLRWEYATDLFDVTTIRRMADHFERLISNAAKCPDMPLYQLDMLSEAEKQQLLVGWNATEAAFATERSLHELFEAQAAKTPEAIALVFDEQQLTYAQLNERANRLAYYLRGKGVGPDVLVGLCVERSQDMVVSLLAILKAGGAYVPLDPDYPAERLAYMIDDAQLQTIITHTPVLDIVPISKTQALCLDDPSIVAALAAQPEHNFAAGELGLQPHHLAYVIYTSGSTGKPKGVMVERSQVVNFLASMQQVPGLQASDRLLAVTSTSFDIHGLELFLPLTVGAQLIVASRSATGDPAQLTALLQQHHITMMQATPATWKMLIDADWQQHTPLKVLCGGEALSQSLATELLKRPGVELWNMYGPTETTIWSCCKRILPDQDKILMGQPIHNTQVYVMQGGAQQPSPVGVAGELWIGGLGVTRGYLNRADLTAEKFIANPFYDKSNPASSERVYKTGDLVRWTPEGELEFLGRIDHQVKIRGFRIELGEIENALMTHVAVKDVVVVAREQGGSHQLVAYVVPEQRTAEGNGGKSDDEAQEATDQAHKALAGQLREHIGKTLPEYMVPAHIVVLESLPLTPNGKVDRKALPTPDLSQQQNEYVAPRTEVERQLAEIWQQVLGVARVGVTDNFFRLGGDSLNAVRVVGKAGKAGISFFVPQIFKHQTIAELVNVLNNGKYLPAEQETITGEVPLSPAQLFFLNTTLHQPNWGNALYFIDSKTLNVPLFKEAWTQVLHHHDGLRSKFIKAPNGWKQIILAPEEVDLSVDYFDVSDLSDQQQITKLDSIFLAAQGQMDLSHAPLIDIKIFHRGEARGYVVRINIHHLLVDDFSTTVLMEDFTQCYESLLREGEFIFPQKTASTLTWLTRLTEDVNSPSAEREIDYWLGLPWQKAARFPIDYVDRSHENTAGSNIELIRELPRSQTSALQALAISLDIPLINILVAVLAKTLAAYAQAEWIPIRVLDAGRGFDLNLDVSRTVSWLCVHRHLMLNVPSDDIDSVGALKSIHGQIQGTPNKGFGLELLQCYHKDEKLLEQLATIPKAELFLNFHGVFDDAPALANSTLTSEEAFSVNLNKGNAWCHWIDPQNINNEKFTVNGSISDGKLSIAWRYSKNLYDTKNMTEILNRIVEELTAISVIADVETV